MKKQVWIIDDNEFERFMTRKMLEMCNPDVDVTEFEDGFDAILKMKSSGAPDKILLDLNMPMMDGWAFLDAVVELNIEKEKFICILCGGERDKDRERALQYKSILNFFLKPFTERYLSDVC